MTNKQKKMNLFKQNLSEQKHETPENNNFKQDLSKSNVKKSNNEIVIDENEIDNSFESMKKLFENNDGIDKKDEKVVKKEENQLNQMINNLILSIFQRYNKYNTLLQQKSKFTNSLKDYYSLEYFQNEIMENKTKIEKLEIQLNEMKTIIKYLLPANIVNIKRKILDIVIFSILKKNKASFQIDENYCPNKNFLDKIYNRLNEFDKRENLSEDQKNKIKDKIKFINNQRIKKNSSITFLYKCLDLF